jgi:hypothetical protein
MFARPDARHHQIAYVTNDLDAAVALFERDYGAPGFFVFSNVGSGAHQPGEPELRIALSNVGGNEIELIEPIGDTAPLFKDLLPRAGAGDDTELVIRFHHICIRIEGDIDNWNAHTASIDTVKHPIVFSGAMGDNMRFFYTDETQRLGHYVEHVWMSPAIMTQLRSVIPRYPAQEQTT